MNRRRLGLALAIGAFFLAVIFIDYRVQPVRVCPGSFDVICLAPNEIVTLGLTDIKPPPDSDLARYHGKIGADRGLYSRYGLPRAAAVVGGILLPLLMLVTSIILIVRPSRKDFG